MEPDAVTWRNDQILLALVNSLALDVIGVAALWWYLG